MRILIASLCVAFLFFSSQDVDAQQTFTMNIGRSSVTADAYFPVMLHGDGVINRTAVNSFHSYGVFEIEQQTSAAGVRFPAGEMTDFSFIIMANSSTLSDTTCDTTVTLYDDGQATSLSGMISDFSSTGTQTYGDSDSHTVGDGSILSVRVQGFNDCAFVNYMQIGMTFTAD